MSHAPERREKNCLNCNTPVIGKYCHICGQANVIPHDTVGHMIQHFFYDITHFDSKFLDTVRILVTRPGFLSLEYIRGRRASYLNPVKMYVFTSAIFFLVFFSLYGTKNLNTDNATPTKKELTRVKNYAFSRSENASDSAAIKTTFEIADGESLGDTVGRDGVKIFSFESDRDFASVEEYDSVQASLPAAERDSWIARIFKKRSIVIENKYKEKGADFLLGLGDSFLHMFPYMLFVSLPLYALFLKILYRRRKDLFIVDHGIFLVHLYIFTFIVMLLFFGVQKLGVFSGMKWLSFVQAALIIYGIYYTFRGLRVFYGQGFWKTLVKFILFNILCIISLIIIFTGFMLFVVFRV